MMRKVLFVCIHNSARSQMAEAFTNALCGDHALARSAGLEPGVLNPLVVEVMREIGIDLSGKETRAVFDVYKRGERFDDVVTVCDEASAERCPVFPGVANRLHWSFPDPSSFQGSWEERLEQTRGVRDAIRARVAHWCAEIAGRTEDERAATT
ncbi:MAG TPA: arsenate reductase ArsC [Candidatus Dormibacteraeota bacterium]|nr:arsenate reductase ArsC [Candidatus Dormibacteraeota bacterium]